MSKSKVSSLAFCSGALALLDTLIGGIAALGLDRRKPNEIAMSIAFILGFPAFLADAFLRRRIPIVMLAVFIFRWLIRCYDGKRFALCDPFVWPVGILLAGAIVLFQAYLYRRSSEI